MTGEQALQRAAAFLRAVLPDRREDEVYRLEIFPRPEFVANNFVSIEKMAAHLLRFGMRPYNAYFALATFPRGGRDRLAEPVVGLELLFDEARGFLRRQDARH